MTHIAPLIILWSIASKLITESKIGLSEYKFITLKKSFPEAIQENTDLDSDGMEFVGMTEDQGSSYTSWDIIRHRKYSTDESPVRWASSLLPHSTPPIFSQRSYPSSSSVVPKIDWIVERSHIRRRNLPTRLTDISSIYELKNNPSVEARMTQTNRRITSDI